MILLLILIATISWLYLLVFKPMSYWSKKNVKTEKVIPLFGDNFWVMFGKESYPEKTLRLYNNAKGRRYVGAYDNLTPLLIPTSPEMVKRICVKDFDYFYDHKSEFSTDDLWTKGLVGLKGEAWRVMRSTLSPSFTSSKMRAMFVLMCQTVDEFTQYFVKRNEEIIEVEFRDTFTRLANDIIASSAFGIQVNSLENRNNQFYLMGRSISDFNSNSKKLAYFLTGISPKLADMLDISFFGRAEQDFFMNTVRDSIKIREEQNINRPDMLGLLIEARKNKGGQKELNESTDESFAAVKEHIRENEKLKYLTDRDIASQMFIFFFGGFDTISTGLCFTAYELAVNSDVQKKLIEEIDENRPENGQPSYETIMKMTYLDMVVSESFRKWPPGVETDRIVTKPYTIESQMPNEEPVDIGTEVHVTIPILGFHRDPKYYPDPEKFDPERFSPENRKTIDPYTYLPFGVGPRNCIASRYAIMEIKAVFFHLLSHFELVPIESTNIPLKLNKALFSLDSENGFPLGLKRRH